MKTDVSVLTAIKIIYSLEVVVGFPNERKPDQRITYIDRRGDLYEGGNLLLAKKDILQKVARSNAEVILHENQYALLCWNEEA